MKITKQLKTFVTSINKELEAYEKERNSLYTTFKDLNRHIVIGIKDTIYLLGTSYGKEYEWSRGFEKFCKEIGINWDLLNKL